MLKQSGDTYRLSFFRHPIILFLGVLVLLWTIFFGEWTRQFLVSSTGLNGTLALNLHWGMIAVMIAFGSIRIHTTIDPTRQIVRWERYLYWMPYGKKELHFGQIRCISLRADSQLQSARGTLWPRYGATTVLVSFLANEVFDSLMGALNGIRVSVVDQDRREWLIELSGNERATAALATEVARMTDTRLGF